MKPKKDRTQLQEEVEVLRTVYEGVNHPIFAIDVLPDGDFRYVGCNAAAEKVTGMRSEEIVGKTPEEIYGASAGILERQQLQKFLESGEVTSYEKCLSFAEKESWWMTTHNPVKDSDGKVFRFISTMFYISDRRKSEAELVLTLQELQRKQAEIVQVGKMSSLLQLMVGIIHEVGGPFGFIHGNMPHIKAYTQDLLELIALYQQAYPNPTKEIADKIEDIDLEFIATDLSKSLASMQIGSERIREVLKALRQFSGWGKAEVISVNMQAETMSGLKGLVAGIAHEINNPVNFIHGNIPHIKADTQNLLELIALYQQAYPNPTKAIADKIEDIDLDLITTDLPNSLASMQVGTKRIREIVESLRLFSRLDKAEVKSVDIHDSIDSTLTLLQTRIIAQSDRAEIQIIKDYGNLPLVECFAAQLNQVFMNILSNAIDALESRDRMRSLDEQKQHPSIIRIITEMTANEQVSIRIVDNGIGIPKHIQNRIFDPFFTTKPVGKGKGMGLSISYQIVTKKHGGKLFCHSIPGQGTEFTIQIPVIASNSGKNTSL